MTNIPKQRVLEIASHIMGGYVAAGNKYPELAADDALKAAEALIEAFELRYKEKTFYTTKAVQASDEQS